MTQKSDAKLGQLNKYDIHCRHLMAEIVRNSIICFSLDATNCNYAIIGYWRENSEAPQLFYYNTLLSLYEIWRISVNFRH